MMERADHTQGDARVAALREGVKVYRGDLLEDAPYEEWVAADRDRLLQCYLDALAELAGVEAAAGRPEAALALWRTVIARSPADERAWRGVIRGHLAMGRRADAIRAFEQCRAALADLGAAPSAETSHLRESIALPGVMSS